MPQREDQAPAPLSPYAVLKLAGEQYAKVWHRLYGVEAVGLRYFNVFGPHQDPLSKAKRQLGYVPLVAFDEGLARAVEFYRSL